MSRGGDVTFTASPPKTGEVAVFRGGALVLYAKEAFAELGLTPEMLKAIGRMGF